MTSAGRSFAALRDMREDIRVFGEAQQRRALAVFFELVPSDALDPPIGDGSGHHRDIGRQRGFASGQHFRRGLDRYDPNPGRCRLLRRPRNQHRLGAQRAQRRRDRMALLARGVVRDVAHRVDRLARRPARHQCPPAGEPRVARPASSRSRRRSPAARPSAPSRPRRKQARRSPARCAPPRAPREWPDWPGSPDAPTSSNSSSARSAPSCPRRATPSSPDRRPDPRPCARSGRRWPAPRRPDRPRATDGCAPSRSRRSATTDRCRPCPRTARRPIAGSRNACAAAVMIARTAAPRSRSRRIRSRLL